MYLHSNTQAQWYNVLCDLQEETSTQLPSEIEHYLLLTLINTTQDISILDSFLSQDLLNAVGDPYKPERWQDLGDKCLILGGFFPEWTNRRVRSEAFIANLGKLGYSQASLQHFGANQKIFEYLHHHYDEIVEFLNNMKFHSQTSRH